MGDKMKFYGIGVGPGDPELLTVKAARLIKEVDVIFAAGHERSGKSLALEIAGPHLPEDGEIVALPFPHTFDSVDGRDPHREVAQKIVETLKRPATAAFLTLGDPMTFSTFTYVLEELKKLAPEVEVEVVPGITSFAAAAAATQVPLAEGEESFTVLGAARGGMAKLKNILPLTDNLVIMKPYRQTVEVCDLLEEHGLGDSTWFCTECSRETELITRGLTDARENKGRYMSLFLVRKGATK